MDTQYKWLPQLLQSSDSFFPTGSYAHSFGLEGMVQLDLIRDRDTLAEFIGNQVVPALVHQELPAVRHARKAADDRDLERLCVLDERYGAMKTAFEMREASRRIGTQRLRMMLELAREPFVEQLDGARANGRFHAHAPVVLGVQLSLTYTPLHAGLVACYYQCLLALVSAAMKLIRLGQMAAQVLLADFLRQSPDAIARSMAVDEDAAGWFQPVLDIASARHETAHIRLFIS